MQCEQCEKMLFEYESHRLTQDIREAVEAHLKDCDECSALLADIWAMSLVASRWQDREVPAWPRRRFFFAIGDYGFMPQLLATAASLLVLVLVLAQVQISAADGLSVAFGGSQYVRTADFDARLSALESNQERAMNARLDALAERQVATSQFLLRTLLETTRQERREDIGNLAAYWSRSQDTQYRQTEESLRYLLASQADDEHDIRQLGEALRQISFERGNDL